MKSAAICLLTLVTIAGGTPARAQQPHSADRPSHAVSKSFLELSVKATAAQDAGNLVQAAALFRKALALNPRWLEGWWSLGELDYQGDRYVVAASDFRRVVALDPNYGTARAMLGLSEFEVHEDKAALSDIEASKELGMEQDPQLRQVVVYHEAILLQRASRYEQASEALSSLCLGGVRSAALAQIFGMTMLHIDSNTAPPDNTAEGDVVQHIGRGACLSAANQYDPARLEYQYALQKAPHFPLIHYAYGRFLLEAHDRSGAIDAFRQEIAEHPDSVLPRLEIAVAQYKVDSTAGLPFAQQAVALAPQSPLPNYLLGLLLLDTGDAAAAVPHLELASKTFSSDARIYWSLGVAYARVGRTKDAADARATFARLKQANPADQNAVTGLAPGAIPPVDVKDTAGATPKP